MRMCVKAKASGLFGCVNVDCRYSLERMDAFGKGSIVREEWLAVVLLSDS